MKEIDTNELMTAKEKDLDGILNQVNLKRLRNADDSMINHDRIKKLNNIRESIQMLDQE